jgi:uncharacterized protein YhaN
MQEDELRAAIEAADRAALEALLDTKKIHEDDEVRAVARGVL